MEIPTRADVPETDKWDLTDLFADVSKWQEDFAWLQREYPKLEQWKGRVGESAQTLAGLLEFEKALEQKMERVYHYASLQAAEDSTNNEYLARIGQVQNLLTRISEAAAFVVPEILAIDDERFGKFLADPALKDWAIKLHKIRRMRSHILSVPEERLLAEVASTFNEELLTHHLLQTTSDPKMRAYIINREIDDLRGTLFRQTMFAEFEKIIHAIEESGDALTLDVFKSEYHKLLETYFAENFVLDPELDLECLRIPHFYHAFYVYKYATGISAAVALSQRVLSGQPGSVEAYLKFLRSGGSRFPLETLKAAGVDMTTPAPIESTLQLFERRLEELEALLL
jgi:oligoendopeptidase F